MIYVKAVGRLQLEMLDDTNLFLFFLSFQPLSRFFHAAALMKDTMVIVGGRTGEEDYSNTVSLYQINCNTWIQPGNSYKYLDALY